MKKKAQEMFGMSFSTIFSIIIIASIVLVAFFAIRHFIGLTRCSNIGLFYDDLREEVNDAWVSSSGIYEGEFESKISNSGLFGAGIEFVCFGNLSSQPWDSRIEGEIMDNLINKYNFDITEDYNVFIYPPDNGCDSQLGAIKLKCGRSDCVNTKDSNGVSKFFCVPVGSDGIVKVKLLKTSWDYQIKLQKP